MGVLVATAVKFSSNCGCGCGVFCKGIAGSSRAHAVHATWLNTWMSEWLDLTGGRTWIAIWRT
jgi:hypothetical protein